VTVAGPLPPPFDPPTGFALATAAGLVERIVHDGLSGPVFVVASDDSVGALAPVWAEAFSRVGWQHCVRVLSPRAEGAELADLAVDLHRGIGGFTAGVIVVAAPPSLIDAVRRMAGAEGPPVVVWPPRSADGNALPAD
jgi:hypothetical protein